MTSPAKETSLSWSRVMGLMRKATSASPESTRATASCGVADEADVAEAGDGVLVEAEELVEDDGVELDDVELAPGVAGDVLLSAAAMASGLAVRR